MLAETVHSVVDTFNQVRTSFVPFAIAASRRWTEVSAIGVYQWFTSPWQRRRVFYQAPHASDFFAQVLLRVGIVRSKRAPTRQHPYGCAHACSCTSSHNGPQSCLCLFRVPTEHICAVAVFQSYVMTLWSNSPRCLCPACLGASKRLWHFCTSAFAKHRELIRFATVALILGCSGQVHERQVRVVAGLGGGHLLPGRGPDLRARPERARVAAAAPGQPGLRAGRCELRADATMAQFSSSLALLGHFILRYSCAATRAGHDYEKVSSRGVQVEI